MEIPAFYSLQNSEDSSEGAATPRLDLSYTLMDTNQSQEAEKHLSMAYNEEATVSQMPLSLTFSSPALWYHLSRQPELFRELSTGSLTASPPCVTLESVLADRFGEASAFGSQVSRDYVFSMSALQAGYSLRTSTGSELSFQFGCMQPARSELSSSLGENVFVDIFGC
ncbi:unnamed protein product [Protopolystoma xenopodis]|uniref:Uncharacterized protein n=1 Tax=Protopolystoma xenopodis TaxID=117903 RepID=A0A448XAS8_9PLAT|nr:unnamed protein product [Protopolystoma xenopodis]